MSWLISSPIFHHSLLHTLGPVTLHVSALLSPVCLCFPAMHFLSSSGELLCLPLSTPWHDISLLCYLAALTHLNAVFICLFPHKISHEGWNLYLIYIWIPCVQYLLYSKWPINLCFMDSPLPYFSPLCLSTQREWKDSSLCINPNRARHILVIFI